MGEQTTGLTAVQEPVEVREIPMEVFIAGCVLCGAGCLLALVFTIFNLQHRKSRMVRMSSPNINLVLLGGAFVAYVCCVLVTLGALTIQDDGGDDQTQLIISCQVLTWLLPVSFTLVFGAMFTKSWRVRRIFLNAPHKKVVVKDHMLFTIILALLVIDVLLLSVWHVLDPPRVTSITETIKYNTTTLVNTNGDSLAMQYEESVSLQTCTSRYSPIWMAAIFVYKTFILLYGVYLSWTVRSVTLPAMNDTTAIILSSLLTAFVSMATAVVMVWFRFHPDVTSSLLMASIWICTTVTLCLNFIPKMKLLWQNSEEELLKVTMASQVIYSPNQSIDQVEDEIYHLVAENRGLKKALGQKEQKIKALQEHVTTAKEKLESLIIEDKQDSGLDADMSSSSNQDEEITQQPTSNNNTKPERKDSSDSGQPEETVLGNNGHKNGAISSKNGTITNKYSANSHKNSANSHKNSANTNKNGVNATADNHYGIYVRNTDGSSVSSNRYTQRQTSSSRASLRGLSQAWFKFARGRRPSMVSSSNMGSVLPPRSMPLDHYQRSRLRDSLGDLVHELHTVDYLSSSLCRALTEDLNRARNRSSVVYDQVRAKQDIAGSIVDSYDLDNMSDTYSYVSNHIGGHGGGGAAGHRSYLQPMRYTRGYIQDDIESASQVCNGLRLGSSSESISTIGNDRAYYPSTPAGRFGKRGHQSRRLGQRGGWKREPKQKIFTVFGPKQPEREPPVAQAGVKILYDEGTYV